MQKIVFQNLDGSVGVVTPSATWGGTLIALAEKVVPAGLTYRIIDDAQLPADKTFRDAWTDAQATDTVDVDIVKAQAIQKERIRTVRKALFETLDVAYQRADEEGDNLLKQEISAKKQVLRDFTSRVDGVVDVAELAMVLPDESYL